jgi:hypothetical protein
VKSELFKAVTVNIIVFWNATPCNLVKLYGHFEEIFFLHLYDTIKKQEEVPLYSEDVGSTLLSLHQNTRRCLKRYQTSNNTSDSMLSLMCLSSRAQVIHMIYLQHK